MAWAASSPRSSGSRSSIWRSKYFISSKETHHEDLRHCSACNPGNPGADWHFVPLGNDGLGPSALPDRGQRQLGQGRKRQGGGLTTDRTNLRQPRLFPAAPVGGRQRV